ncbi:E3 SUMO-protein ligase pli1 [Ciborinia camelliae]|nr:E3 SUMO-protein ligase pli1 [Ciborinia camelliae]
MASMGGGGFLDPEPFVRKVKNGGFLNQTLKNICAAEQMKFTGVKAELQNRIIERIRFYANTQDDPKFHRLGRIIEHPETALMPPHTYQGSASPAATSIPNGAANYNTPGAAMQSYNRPNGYGMKIDFKPSPFYTLIEQIGDIKTCEAMTQHRHTVNIPVKVQTHPTLSRVLNDPTLKIMIFCASEGNGRQDIAFPHQSEIKVNGGDVKANLRGLKNKPGSTRPVDITKELRLKVPGYQNTVEMTYALTTKAGLNGNFVASEKFYLVLWVVKTVAVTDLVEKLEGGKKITKESVVNDNADIVATASVLSLKCPLSTLRIDLPCRSISCRHNQCFDATSYLQLQEQGPTWLCPICNNSAPFETLVVDEYVKNILKSTSRSVDQVTVEPEGQWKLYNKPDPTSSRPGVASSDFSDDDDDLIELSPDGGKLSTSITKTEISNGNGTQAPSARDSLSAAPSNRSNPTGSLTGSKRPITEIIDLTSSGDEEEPPAKHPAKRQFNPGSSSLNDAAPSFRPTFQNR